MTENHVQNIQLNIWAQVGTISEPQIREKEMRCLKKCNVIKGHIFKY